MSNSPPPQEKHLPGIWFQQALWHLQTLTQTHMLWTLPKKTNMKPNQGTRHWLMQTNVLRAGTPWLRHQRADKWLAEDSGPQMDLHFVAKYMEVHDLWLRSSRNITSVPISSTDCREMRFRRFSGAFSIQLLQSCCECHAKTHVKQYRYFVWPGAGPNPHECIHIIKVYMLQLYDWNKRQMSKYLKIIMTIWYLLLPIYPSHLQPAMPSEQLHSGRSQGSG